MNWGFELMTEYSISALKLLEMLKYGSQLHLTPPLSLAFGSSSYPYLKSTLTKTIRLVMLKKKMTMEIIVWPNSRNQMEFKKLPWKLTNCYNNTVITLPIITSGQKEKNPLNWNWKYKELWRILLSKRISL